jgi:hypothetical protein
MAKAEGVYVALLNEVLGYFLIGNFGASGIVWKVTEFVEVASQAKETKNSISWI